MRNYQLEDVSSILLENPHDTSEVTRAIETQYSKWLGMFNGHQPILTSDVKPYPINMDSIALWDEKNKVHDYQKYAAMVEGRISRGWHTEHALVTLPTDAVHDIMIIYCDGSISNNGNRNRSGIMKGGIGIVGCEGPTLNSTISTISRYFYHDSVEESDGSPLTNSRTEMLAFIHSLIIAYSFSSKEIHVRTDSQYCERMYNLYLSRWQNNGWKTSAGGDVKNQDLCLVINAVKSIILASEISWNRKVIVQHIPGHRYPIQELSDKAAAIPK